MARKTYNKLVRDEVVPDLKQKGLNPKSHIAKDDQYFWQKLQEKLKEEVDEFLDAKSSDEKEKEFIDIQEAMDAMLDFWGPMIEQSLKSRRAKKAKEKGRFYKRIILEEADV